MVQFIEFQENAGGRVEGGGGGGGAAGGRRGYPNKLLFVIR